MSQLPSAVRGTSRHARLSGALRSLAIDAVEQARSGHPGMPMGMADVATVLFSRHLRTDPKAPDWPNRDRFVLSAGHGSMLLYGILYLLGHADMPLAELRRFRQLGSRSAGHPEYGHASGIEVTTGPLGQGLAMGVGMAIGEHWLRQKLGARLIDHRIYVVVGDGCLMEGISHEAIGLAGHLGLDRLIVLFDDNSISIDGAVSLTDSTDQRARFRAAGWDTVRIDGHDPEAIHAAISAAKRSKRPSLICCKTIIGLGAPTKQGTAAAHGAPLGPHEAEAARKAFGFTGPRFRVAGRALEDWRKLGRKGQKERMVWEQRIQALPDPNRNKVEKLLHRSIPPELAEAINQLKKDLAKQQPKIATRKASELVLEVVNRILPTTIGGSADLTGSNNTLTPGLGIISRRDFSGRYLHWGIREHAMGAAMNGMAMEGGIIPYGGSFLVFTDYARPAIRMAALMGVQSIFVMTHDSIGLGEDGPTHQPVEHLAMLRATPNLQVFRPADAIETAECWQLALNAHTTPSVLALSRQNLPTLRSTHRATNLSARGAYVISESTGDAKALLIATGSELCIAMEAQVILQNQQIPTRVISMPCEELFLRQSAAYRRKILPSGTVRVAIEAGGVRGWERWLYGEGGNEESSGFIGMHSFGASAPAPDLYRHFGIDTGSVVRLVQRLRKTTAKEKS